jgi:hypothetical protein
MSNVNLTVLSFTGSGILCFYALAPHGVRHSSCFAVSSNYAILLQTGPHEVTVNLSGSFGYFLARSLVLLNDWSFGKANAKGVQRCSLLSLVLYPKPVYFVS